MKHGLLHAFGFVATVLLTLSAGPAGAATTAAGPYYANPSWDQQLAASTRFVVLSNWIDAAHPSGGAAVLDRETGLVWEISPSTSNFGWADAQVHCNGLRTGNRLGWRLRRSRSSRALWTRRSRRRLATSAFRRDTLS